MSPDDVTLVITSCCRLDLLDRTIESLFRNERHPFYSRVLIDDGRDEMQRAVMRVKYGGRFKLILEEPRGQMAAIDRAYAEVETEYVLHCEDDWEFSNGPFMERSLRVLEERPDIGIVMIRRSDVAHPLQPDVLCTRNGVHYQKPVLGWSPGKGSKEVWNGFTLNPGLRRMSDYRRMAPYAECRHTGGEHALDKRYRALGLESAVLTTNHVTHIGEGRCSRI